MVKVELHDPKDFDRSNWQDKQVMAWGAFRAALENRSDVEIDSLVDRDNSERYYWSHRDPNSEVGGHFNPNQSYSNPRVAEAFVDGTLAGWGYAADNVSGANELIRTAKRLSVVKNYLWLREIVVNPAYQRRGVAKEIGRTLLESANEHQPVATYAWPDDDPAFIGEELSKLGFTPTGEKEVQLFGLGFKPTRQVRMQASSVKSVLERL